GRQVEHQGVARSDAAPPQPGRHLAHDGPERPVCPPPARPFGRLPHQEVVVGAFGGAPVEEPRDVPPARHRGGGGADGAGDRHLAAVTVAHCGSWNPGISASEPTLDGLLYQTTWVLLMKIRGMPWANTMVASLA